LNRRALESLIKCGCFDGLGANRRQLMMVCQTVIDNVAEHKRRNVDWQMDFFGMDDLGQTDTDDLSFGGIELPDFPDYTKSELTRMEREVTGLYLSGHPMDEFRSLLEPFNTVSIGDVLADFSREAYLKRFKDDQKIVIAGVIESVKTKPTRNNSLMAYIMLDDGSGSIELLAFQRAIDESGEYMQAEVPVLAYGRISERDDKDPQIVLNKLYPIKDALKQIQEKEFSVNDTSNPVQEKTLYVKMPGEDCAEYERLKLVHMMFPGTERMVIHFNDTKKNVGAKCIIHEAFVNELSEMLGAENVVVR